MGQVGNQISSAVKGFVKAGPVQQFVGSVKQLVKDPTKLNIGQAASVLIPIGGSLIVDDIKHPKNAVIEAAVLGGALGAHALFSGAAVTTAPAVTGGPLSGISPLATPTVDAFGTPALTNTAAWTAAGADAGALGATAPAVAASVAASGGFLAGVGGLLTTGLNFVKDLSIVKALTGNHSSGTGNPPANGGTSVNVGGTTGPTGAPTDTGGIVDTVLKTLGLGGTTSGAGAVQLGGGVGGDLAQLAGMSPLMIFFLVGAAVTLIWYYMKRRKK